MEELVEKAKRGEEQAFLSLMELHEELLYRTALGYLRNEQEAIEAVQEVTYRCYRKIRTLKNHAYFKTWLVRILLNVCADMVKNKKRYTERNELADTIPFFDNDFLELMEAIDKLQPNQQEIIHLKYFQDLKNNEIAELQRIPEGTVKSRLHTAIGKLRKLMGNEEGWR